MQPNKETNNLYYSRILYRLPESRAQEIRSFSTFIKLPDIFRKRSDTAAQFLTMQIRHSFFVGRSHPQKISWPQIIASLIAAGFVCGVFVHFGILSVKSCKELRSL